MKSRSGISVVICAYQRPSYLLDVVKGVISQQIKGFNLELLISYKGSDGPQLKNEIAALIKNNHPIEFHLLHQKSLGTSRARNLGIINSKYDVVVFIDDDTYPQGKLWAKRIYKIFRNAKISAACGKTLFYSTLKPEFNLFRGYYTYWQKGSQPKFLPQGAIPPSSHLIVRKSLLYSLGGFRGEIGRSAKLLIGGEDDELTSSIGKLGIRFWYDPQLVVRHRIPEERFCLKYLCHRVFWQGPTDAICRKYIEGFHQSSLSYMVYRLVNHSLRFVAQTLKRGRFRYWNKFQMTVYWAMLTGEIYGRFSALFFRVGTNRPIDINKNI